jgi:hypothetical protein
MFCEMISDTRLLLDVMNNAMKVATKKLLQLNKEACGLENVYNFNPSTSYLDKPMWIHQLLLKDPNPPTFIDG